MSGMDVEMGRNFVGNPVHSADTSGTLGTGIPDSGALFSISNSLTRGVFNEGIDIDQSVTRRTSPRSNTPESESADHGFEQQLNISSNQNELVVMIVCAVLSVSSCIHYGVYEDRVECEEESGNGEECDHDIMSFLIGLVCIMWLLLGVQYYINRNFRITRRENMRTSEKMLKLYVFPIAVAIFSFAVDANEVFSVPWHVLLAIIIFQMTSAIGVIITLKEINANTRFIKKRMSGMYVRKPMVTYLDDKDTFRIGKSNNTVDGTLKAFAASFPDLRDFASLLNVDFRLIMITLVVVFSTSLTLFYYAESRVERLQYRNVICLTELFFIFMIQLSSGWLITSFNKYLTIIEEFHHLDSQLLVQVFGIVPDNSLVLTLIFYMFYTFYMLM